MRRVACPATGGSLGLGHLESAPTPGTEHPGWLCGKSNLPPSRATTDTTVSGRSYRSSCAARASARLATFAATPRRNVVGRCVSRLKEQR